MSERGLPVLVIQAHAYRTGAEVGVWRGDRAWAILDGTAVESLMLVDPWIEELNRFRTTERVPDRMVPGRYHCTMGEPHQTQHDLNQMALAVSMKALAYGERAKVYRLRSEEMLPMLVPHSLDFVCLDGIHLWPWIEAQSERWLTKIRPGGMLMLDTPEGGFRQHPA